MSVSDGMFAVICPLLSMLERFTFEKKWLVLHFVTFLLFVHFFSCNFCIIIMLRGTASFAAYMGEMRLVWPSSPFSLYPWHRSSYSVTSTNVGSRFMTGWENPDKSIQDELLFFKCFYDVIFNRRWRIMHKCKFSHFKLTFVLH